MAIANSYNFRPVSERLTTSGVVGGNRLKGLAAEDYQAVVNLLPDSSEHAVAGEREIIEAQGCSYVYIPVDFSQPTVADFDRFAAALDELGERKLHLHCAANYRVSAFYALYARQRGLWGDMEAEQFVAGLWNPRRFPPWLQFMANVQQRIGPP